MDVFEDFDPDLPYYYVCGICELYGKDPEGPFPDDAAARAHIATHEGAHPYPAIVFIYDLPSDFSGVDTGPIRAHIAEAQTEELRRVFNGQSRMTEESILERLGFNRADIS